MLHECDCRECACCSVIPGPAVYNVTRDGVRMHVCTRCDLSTDLDKESIPVVELAEHIDELFEYDPLGTVVLLSQTPALTALVHGPVGEA